jgi:hypothetical protein
MSVIVNVCSMGLHAKAKQAIERRIPEVIAGGFRVVPSAS